MPTEPTWEETTAIDEPTWETTTETQETQSPGFLGPSWPSSEGEGESIAEPEGKPVVASFSFPNADNKYTFRTPPPPMLPQGTAPVTGGGAPLSISSPAQMPLPRLPFMGGGQEAVPLAEGMQSSIVPLPEAPSVNDVPVTKPEQALLNLTSPGIILKEVLGEDVAAQVARETYNQVKGVPEFFGSLMGLGTAGLGTVAGPIGAVTKAAMTGGFTVDTLRNLVNHIENSYENWGEMSDTEKARAYVKGIGLATLGTLLTHGTVRQGGALGESAAASKQTATGKLSPTTLGIPRLLENLANVWGRPTGLPAREVTPLPPILPPHVAAPVAQRPEDAVINAAEPILPQAAQAARDIHGTVPIDIAMKTETMPISEPIEISVSGGTGGRGGKSDYIVSKAGELSSAIREGNTDNLQHQLQGSAMGTEELQRLIALAGEDGKALVEAVRQGSLRGLSEREVAEVAVALSDYQKGTGKNFDSISTDEITRIVGQKIGSTAISSETTKRVAEETTTTEQERKVSYASSIKTPTTLYGSLRSFAVEGARQVPVEESGAGIFTQTGGGIPAEAQAPNAAQGQPRVLLTPEERIAEQRALDEALGQESSPTPKESPWSGRIKWETYDEPKGEWQPQDNPIVVSKSTIPGDKPWRATVFGGSTDSPVPIGHVQLDTPEITKQAIGELSEQLGRYTRKIQIEKSTPPPKETPTVPPATEPSQLTPTQQGSQVEPISKTTTTSQITQAPFLDIPPEKWTPEYWKRIGDEGRRTVRGNLQGALQKIGSKTKVTERSSPQAVFNAIAEVNKARAGTPPPTPLPPGPGAKTVGEPPYAAAQQLTDQLRATKPTGTKDTYTVRQKLADAWAEGKSLFDRALASSRVTGEGLKDTARGVRAITDLDRRIGELDWLLQKSAAQSRNMGKAIEQQQKSKVTREAVALWIDAGGNEQLLRDALANLPAKTKPSIRRALEVATNLPPEAKQFAQQIEQFYGIRLQDAQQAEIFSKSLDDYFTHIWKKESNMPEKLRAAYSTGRVNDYFQFARQRKLPMFLDGILQGKVPELDPAKVVPYYNYALDRSIASRQFVKELSEVNAPDGRPAVLPTGTARKIEPNEEGAQGGIFINPKGKGELGKDYHVIDHPAMRKWKWLGADENGNPVMYRSDLAANPLVHERLARMLDQRLATPSKVGKQLLRASTEVKGFKLGLLSAFHQVHVGSHALFHWTNPFKTGDIDWESPATKYAVEKGHLKLAGDAAQIANFSEGLLSPGLVHKVPIVGPWSKAYSEWLFTDWIPRLKLKTFENALPRNLAWFDKDIKAGKITPEQVAARVGDSVNNAYGELNHWFLGKYGRSPQFQRILRGIFLAPDFGEARLRFVEKAFTKYGWEERMALATMFLTLYTGARVANWLSHGDPETDLKNAFRVKVKLPGKEQMEWMSMRSVVGDLAHALTGFGQFMYVRLNPLYSRTISDVLFQRDVYGRKLSFGDIAFKRPAQQLVPINLTGLTREDQSLWESAITSAGLQVQHDVPAMDIGKLKRQWLLASDDPKLRTIGEHGEASIYPPSDYAPLRRALASGDLEKAGSEYDALIKDKGKKRADIVDALSWYSGGKEVNGVYRERKVKPIGGQIGAEAEKKFIASLNPAEKRLYQQAMDERKRIYQKFLELLKSR